MHLSRARVYEVLERSRPDDPLSAWVNGFLMGLVALNIAAVIVESVQSVYVQYKVLFDAFEVFSVENLAKLFVAQTKFCSLEKTVIFFGHNTIISKLAGILCDKISL